MRGIQTATRTACAILLMLCVLTAPSSAASITYTQDGSPVLTNGSAAGSVTNLNADDANYYNLTSATTVYPPVQMLVNYNFSANDNGWGKTIGSDSTIAWYNSGQTGGSENVSISGSNKNNNDYIAQNVTAVSQPYNGTVYWCYRVTRWSLGTSSWLAIYLRSPGGSGNGVLLDNVSITAPGAWTCRSNSSILSSVFNSSGAYQLTAQAHLQTTSGSGHYISVLFDDFGLNFTYANYTLNITHNSTATVAVPTNYTLQNVTAYIRAKTNWTPADYSLSWLYNGAYTSTGCNATSHLSSTADGSLICSTTSTPSQAISGGAISLRLYANESNRSFVTSENFINYTILFPNMTSSTASSSSAQPSNGTTFQANCSASADSDYNVTGASYTLQWRNVSAGPTFSDMTTTSSNGLYLNGSTPTNPVTGVTIPIGNSNNQSWTVVANLADNYEIRCFVNSTTGGYQLSSATAVNVTATVYNFTASPAVDNFSVVNNTYIDRNVTLTNTGNQVLSFTCASNASWATNITACPSALAAGSSTNVTFRFNTTGQPVGNPQVLLNFTDATAGSRTTTANVTITLFQIYNFTASPAIDNFTLNNNSYMDRNVTLTNTGNQVLSFTCASNASWTTNITACPSTLAAGSSTNVTFRFNATGQPVGNPQVLLNFTDATAGSRTTIANVTITLFQIYNFTASPAVDNFTLNNNSYFDRNVTLTNTGNQVLSFTCASNASWATNITACPSALAAGSSTNVTFRFNATGQPVGNPQVLLNFTDATAGSRTTIANVTITLFQIYNFTASPAVDNFSVTNNTAVAYIDRNYTLANTGNQVLNIACAANVSWATNITACPSALAAGSSTNVTFRFNATGQPVGNPQVLLNFTDATAGSRTTIANVTIGTVFPTWSPLPSNQTIELGAAFSYAVSATDPQTVVYSINDTSDFKINSASGLIQNNTGLSVGIYGLQINATDASANVNSTTINVSVVDTTIPTVITSSPSDNHIFNVSTVSFSFTDSDNALTNNCSLYIDGILKQSNATTDANGVTTTITQSSIANGAHTWNITCSDGYNTGNSTTLHFTIDTIAPSISIQSPSGTYNSTSVDLNYTATDSGTGLANCSYKVDSGSVIPELTCQNVTLSGLSQGNHAVTVYSTDNAGNANSTSNLFSIDSLPPSVSIARPTSDTYYNSTSVDLNYTAVDVGLSGVANCSYKVDSGSIVPEPSCDNVTLSGVSQGTHTVTVYSTDFAGNSNSTSVSFKVDTTPPSVTLSSPTPDLFTNSTSLTFSFTETDNMAPTANCSLRIDDAVSQTNATVANNTLTSFSVSSLSQGIHNWTVSCLDLAGNNGTAAARNFTVDTTQPTVSITSPASDSFTNSRTIAITGTSTDTNLNLTNISIYQGTDLINSTPSSSASWSISLTVPADGVYNITATAYDKAGNSNATTVQNITVDTVLPAVTITAPTSDSFTNSRTISISGTSTDAHLNLTNISIYQGTTLINSTTSSSASWSTPLTVPADGAYNITATAYDKAGNSNSSTVSDITVDTVVPSVSLQSPMNGAYNSTSVDLNYTATDSGSGIANCSYRLDSNSIVPELTCQNVTLSGLSEGGHTVTVYAMDNAGNTNITSTLFNVDSLPPSVSIQSPANGAYYNSSSVDLNYTAVDYGSTVENCSYRLDSNSVVPESSCDNATLSGLSQGTHTVTVYSMDWAGNTNSSNVSFTVDTILPSVSIQSPSGTYNSTSVDLNYTATDSGTGVANCSYKVDSGAVVPELTCQNATLSGLSQGTHWVTVYATDRAANTNSTAVPFNVDSIPPSVSIENPTNGTYYSLTSVDLNYTVADSGSGVENCSYRLDSDPEVPEPSCDNVTLSNLSDGAHAVTVYSTDYAGNTNGSDVSFAVSTAPPSVGIFSPSDGSFLNDSTITINFTASGAGLNYTNVSIYNGTGYLVDSRRVNASSSGSPCLAPPSGLIAWWPGDDNTTDIIGSNDGTWSGTEAYASGEVDRSFSFDGSSHVRADSGLGISGNSELTLSAWIRPSDISNNPAGAQTVIGLIGSSGTPGTSAAILLNMNGTGSVGFHTSSGGQNTASGILQNDQWYLIAVTKTPGLLSATTKVYVNGVEYSTTNQMGDLVPNFNPVKTDISNGWVGNDDAFPYYGRIDEAQVYGRALNESEIQDIYNAGAFGLCKTSQSGSGYSIQLSVPAEGVYHINATAYNNAGNSSSSIVENITIDTTNPSLTINSPASSSTLYSHTIPISLTVSDTNLNRTVITITNSTGSIVNSATNSSSGTFTVYLSVPVDGAYNITATAHDKAGNINSSTVENITVIAFSNMTVTLVSPPDGNLTNGSSSTTDFVFSASGAPGNASCRLYLNGASVAVNSSVAPDTDTALRSSAAFREGANTWRVGCTFLSQTEYSPSYTLNVDTRPPVWILPRSYSVVHWQLTMNCYNASFSLLNSTVLGDNATAPSGVSVYRQFFFNPGSQCFAGEVRLVLWNG